MAWFIGTRIQARSAVRSIERALGIPRAGRLDGSGLTTRWATPQPISDGRWAFAIDAERAALLSPAEQALVVPLLPIVRRLNPALLGLAEPFASRAPADLPDELELLSEDRWYPTVLRARFAHSAMPATAGATTLYDGSGTPHDLGTQYARADGLTWVAQPVATLAAGARNVLALWVRIRGAAADEKALVDTVVAAWIARNVVARAIDCRLIDGLWVVRGGLLGEGAIAAAWPADWRLLRPGDQAGAPSGDAVVLGQVV